MQVKRGDDSSGETSEGFGKKLEQIFCKLDILARTFVQIYSSDLHQEGGFFLFQRKQFPF